MVDTGAPPPRKGVLGPVLNVPRARPWVEAQVVPEAPAGETVSRPTVHRGLVSPVPAS